MSITRKSDGWWIESPSLAGGACGPYRTKAEAAEDRAGLARFFRDHPEYREDGTNVNLAGDGVRGGDRAGDDSPAEIDRR